MVYIAIAKKNSEENLNSTDNKNTEFLRGLLNGTVIITLITSMLYLLGDSYHRGYLREFNIENSFFPISFQATLLTRLRALKSLLSFVPTFLLVFFIFGVFYYFGRIAFMLPEKTSAPMTAEGIKTKITPFVEWLLRPRMLWNIIKCKWIQGIKTKITPFRKFICRILSIIVLLVCIWLTKQSTETIAKCEAYKDKLRCNQQAGGRECTKSCKFFYGLLGGRNEALGMIAEITVDDECKPISGWVIPDASTESYVAVYLYKSKKNQVIIIPRGHIRKIYVQN